jgi:hypothetical protein
VALGSVGRRECEERETIGLRGLSGGANGDASGTGGSRGQARQRGRASEGRDLVWAEGCDVDNEKLLRLAASVGPCPPWLYAGICISLPTWGKQLPARGLKVFERCCGLLTPSRSSTSLFVHR